ncbi:MAG: HAMP domain-containing sensor histidine kinase [Bacteroidota bacterium]
MNQINRLYALVVVIALSVVAGLAWLFFPQQLLQGILLGIIPLYVLAIGFRFITNRRISSLRNQLHQIISTLEEFDVDEPRKVVFEKSTYPLFNELNENILELIDRIRSNYRANRQFTQNASHELQTPLAVIKGHVELLLDASNLEKKEIQSLGVIMKNTNRLARLNRALILLSKIENNRYSDFKPVDITAVIEEMLENFEDSTTLQDISIEKSFNSPLHFEMSATLAEILFANLFQNATRYNVEGGFIRIIISEQTVTIANSGEELDVAPETLFKRFQRQSDVEESLGLGLSIVQRICELYKIEVQYSQQSGLHQLILRFPMIKTNSLVPRE